MAIYLLNLGFSTQTPYLGTGSFRPYSSTDVGLMQSCAWFVPTIPADPPASWGDKMLPIPAFYTSQWTPLIHASGLSNSDANPITLSNGDFLLIRMFPYTDANFPVGDPVTYLRPSLVFGIGQSSASGGPNGYNSIQAPLMMANGTYCRPVVDDDGAFQHGLNYPPACTIEDGGNSATTWVHCIGKIHSVPVVPPSDAYYSVNVGATGYCVNTALYASFGHDPVIKVKGSGSRDDDDGGGDGDKDDRPDDDGK